MRLTTAHGATVDLAYGMNVHPGGDGRTTVDAIRSTVLPLKTRLGVTGPFGLAVRFSAAGVTALLEDDGLFDELAALLAAEDLYIFTGNAFVHGAFHGSALKDDVYRPAWTEPARLDYTLDFARLLARLMTSVAPGEAHALSLSTAPLAWKGWGTDAGLRRTCATQLGAAVERLRALEAETGVRVALAIEPEPGCTLETTAEVLAFFQEDVTPSEHLAVCYDVCHQAVEWEDPVASLEALARAHVPLLKVQASCALEIPDGADPDGRAALARFDEPVYLHQTSARDGDGRVHVAADLGVVLDDPAWQARGPWRSHFHVPVFQREGIRPLRTTQPDLERVLRYLVEAPRPTWTGHLEVETYTWDVLPDAQKADGVGFDLVDALEREYRWVLDILAEVGTHPAAEVS